MLTEKGKEMLKFAKDGLKNKEKYDLSFPIQMYELTFDHMDSEEFITLEEIDLILENWNGFQLEAKSFVKIGNRRFPNQGNF